VALRGFRNYSWSAHCLPDFCQIGWLREPINRTGMYVCIMYWIEVNLKNLKTTLVSNLTQTIFFLFCLERHGIIEIRNRVLLFFINPILGNRYGPGVFSCQQTSDNILGWPDPHPSPVTVATLELSCDGHVQTKLDGGCE